MSQLDELVTAVAARIADATVSFEAGKLRVNEHGQQRHVIFYRDAGVLKFATGPGRQVYATPVAGAGTTEFVRFQRSESVVVIVRAESEDAVDVLFDAVANAIFDVGGPNVFENENQYQWAGKDSQAAGQHLRRNPEITFMFRMRLSSHPKPKPYAVVAHVQSTQTELGNSVAITVPGP